MELAYFIGFVHLLHAIFYSIYREKMSEFYLVGVLIRREKIPLPRGVFVTFPRPKLQLAYFIGFVHLLHAIFYSIYRGKMHKSVQISLQQKR